MRYSFIYVPAAILFCVAAATSSDSGSVQQSIYPSVVLPRVFDPIATNKLETPIQIRCIFYINLAVWNAWSNYHPTAADIFGRTYFKRPSSEFTNSNKNIAILYSIFRMHQTNPNTCGGHSTMTEFRQIFYERGLNPDDRSMNMSTTIGIGNRAGYDTGRLMMADGWNSEGHLTMPQSQYRLPFQIFTEYEPKNSPWEIKYPFKWQPLLESNGKGFFFRQEHVTPQADRAMMFSFTKQELANRKTPSLYKNSSAIAGKERKDDLRHIKSLAVQTISTSARLNIRKRILAEFMDNKIKAFISDSNSSGVLSIASALRFDVLPKHLNWNMDDDIIYGIASSILSLDVTIIAWKEKRRNDNIRPTGQTMKYLFGDRRFRAWGGPGKRPVRIKAGNWQPYIRTMPHSEYPSGSACLCSSLVEHALIYTKGKNKLPFEVTIPKGSSQFHPGQMPPRDYKLTIPSLKSWSVLCSRSRLWAGVHFRPSLKAGSNLCRGAGRRAQDVVEALLSGKQTSTWQEWFPSDAPKFWED